MAPLPSQLAKTGRLSDFIHDPNPRPARRLAIAQLGTAREQREVYGAYHSSVIAIVDAELRRRDAWRGPGRWALLVSAVALVISALSYATAAYVAFRQTITAPPSKTSAS